MKSHRRNPHLTCRVLASAFALALLCAPGLSKQAHADTPVAESAVAQHAYGHGIGYGPIVHVGTYGGYPVGWGIYGFGPVFLPPFYGHSYNWTGPWAPTFGALAYSPDTGQVGYGWGQPSRFHAENTALNFCGDATCESVVWVRGGCAAIAKSPELESISWSYAYTRVGAELHAKAGCEDAGGLACETLVWVCSR